LTNKTYLEHSADLVTEIGREV